MRSMRWIMALLLALALAGAARGQAEVPAASLPGPPSPAQAEQQRRDQVQKVLNDSGLGGFLQSSGSGVTVGTTDNSRAVPLPDVTQAIPTTADPKKLSSSLQILLLLSLLTLAPSILLMTTCFTRIVIVMSLLRQALGAAQLPPNQVLIGLSLFMTFLVMGPTWERINREAIAPYTSDDPAV